MTQKHIFNRSIAASALLAMLTSPASFALEQIHRQYSSVRSNGMGGLKITTGLYDENFFNNPARVTANPKFRFTLFDPMVEGGANIPDTISKFTGDGDMIQKVADTAGDTNHVRIQTTMPALYIPSGDGKWAFAAALITSTEVDLTLRQSFQVAPKGVVDLGPAVTVGRKLLDEDRLSVGATGHFTYRMEYASAITLTDLLRKTFVAPNNATAQGGRADFDLGATYRLPVGEGSPYRYSVGASLNNVLGGNYSNVMTSKLISAISCDKNGGNCSPLEQPRTLGVGLVATRESWWRFSNTAVAFEVTDMGNNKNGSMYRLVHLGAETHYSVFAFRGGIDQGYLTAGAGVDLRFFTVDFATFAEELSLNPGGNSDRRYALKVAFQI